jgi:hypothetical protein
MAFCFRIGICVIIYEYIFMGWGLPSLLSNACRGLFPCGRAALAWGWPLASIWCQVRECLELCLRSPNAPSCGAPLEHGDGFTFAFTTYAPRSGRLWSPSSLLSHGYQGLFPWRQSGKGVKLPTHLHLVPRSRVRGDIPPFPQYAFMAWCSVKAQGHFYLKWTQL